MATRAKLPKLNYFYYKGELHKKIRINRSADTIVAWSYPQGRAVMHQYTDVRRNGEKAFLTRDVATMFGRATKSLRNLIEQGAIPAPQRTYGLDSNRNPYAYYWSEKDIMNAHDYLMTVHVGRPRKDGLVVPGNLPSKAELRAMIRQSTVTLHVRTEDGEYIPTWEATQF